MFGILFLDDFEDQGSEDVFVVFSLSLGKLLEKLNSFE